MPDAHGDVLLVGSVPLESAREVFITCAAALGGHLDTLPDGEVGPRKSWIQWAVRLDIRERVTGAIALPGDPIARAAAQFDRIACAIPAGVRLGYHFCYGDLADRHLVEPDTLALSVRMANLAIANSGRRVD